MKRDAIPQHEINGIVNRLAGGEALEKIQASLPSIAASWFEGNEESLYRLAGVEKPEPQAQAAAEAEPEDDPEPHPRGKRR
jgi:hypothetical protein